MSSPLSALEHIGEAPVADTHDPIFDHEYYRDDYTLVEAELNNAAIDAPALDIIFRKGVDIGVLNFTTTCSEYNYQVKFKNQRLTKEEYQAIKLAYKRRHQNDNYY